MICIKLSIFLSIFSILIFSCGGSGGNVATLIKDTKTRQALIIKNASKITAQSISLAKKNHIYKEEKLPKNLDCIKLGFSDNTSRDINLSLVNYKKYTKKIGNKDLVCEMYDYDNFDKNISGELNIIFILNN